jgi:hypothetical protein
MPGELNLNVLLASMDPQLLPEEYFVCRLPEETAPKVQPRAIMWFREAEGITAIVPASDVSQLDTPPEGPFRMVTLTVHSSMDAVGLLAAVTGELARAGIPVNVYSAYFHDHLLIRSDRVHQALEVLRRLQADSAADREEGNP